MGRCQLPPFVLLPYLGFVARGQNALSRSSNGQFCLKPLTSFFGIFCLDVLFTNMIFSRFLLHGENEMWWYTLLEAVTWSLRHMAQFIVTYFTKIIFLLLYWMSYMLYTSPGKGQSTVSRAQDLQGKRRKTKGYSPAKSKTLVPKGPPPPRD